MIHPGLCSLTLGHLAPKEVLTLCRETGLTHIEWWGKDHVPVGDIETANAVGELTRQAGITISTYGSYYRVGESEKQAVTFDNVLRTAASLGAPAIRVWAGTRGSDTVTDQQRAAVIAAALRIADLCVGNEMDLVFEYHRNTLTDSNESAAAFARAIDHPRVFFGWQARTGAPLTENEEGLQGMLPWLATLHVFNWVVGPDGKFQRLPLRDAADDWRVYLDLVAETNREHVALLEFVRDNSVQQFKEDARALVEWTTP